MGRVGVSAHELGDERVLRLRHIGWHKSVNGAPLYTVCPLLRWQPGCGELQLAGSNTLGAQVVVAQGGPRVVLGGRGW